MSFPRIPIGLDPFSYSWSSSTGLLVSSWFIWLAPIIIILLRYLSLPQAPVYGNFQRVGGTVFRWTAVHELVATGYKNIIKPTKKPIVVRWWAKDYLIMPANYLTDLRTAGWDHLHFFRNISDALYLHTTIGDMYTSPFAERMTDVVKKGLNPKLPQLTSVVLEEINEGFEKGFALGQTRGKGKEVATMQFFSGIMHRIATRVMIGPELCRDELFLQETTNLLESIFFTAIVIVTLPLGPLRPALAWLLTLPHKWKLEKCSRMLQPVVEARIQRRELPKSPTSDGHHIGDAIEWTLDLVKGDATYDTPERLTYELLHNLWAASSAPGGMLTEIVYQMLMFPEYLQPLRLEAETATNKYGWSEKMLADLRLQDSFIREVNRLLPTGAITCSRTVTGKAFSFSDGLTLPVGTRFGFPIKAMQSDSDNFKCPEEFDGYRFMKTPQEDTAIGGLSSEDTHRSSATAMSATNLAWGYGTHVCPGRFFAVRCIKIILTKLLLEFDVEWERNRGDKRPECIHVEGQFVPNRTQKIILTPRGRA